MADQLEPVVAGPDPDAWVLDSVKECRLDHGVMDHVEEYDPVADFERCVKAIISDDVACKTGVSAQAVVELFFSGGACSDDFGAVRHFETVRHVSADGYVQNGDVLFVVDNVFDGCDKFSGLPTDRFSWFKNNLNARVAAMESIQNGNQSIDFIILARNVMATAKVHPFHFGDEFAKAFFEVFKDRFESVCVLFAKGVEMQAFNVIE